MIEGSGSESGSIPLTNGSGSGSTTLAYTVILLFRDQWKKEKRQRLAAARESALSNEQAMIESRYPVNQ